MPSIATSTNTLNPFTTVTGIASTPQSFTSTGANLIGSITVAAPANFEVSLSSGSGYADQLTTVTAASTPIFTRVKASAPPGIYSGNVTLSTPGGAQKQVAVSATVLSAEPTTSATTVTFSNVSSIAMTTGWTPGNGANRLVVVKAGSAVDSAPVDGTTYTASSVFGQGSEIGSGNFVVYSGNSNTVNITGLNPATTYHVAVYEFNGTAGTQNYRTTLPATGSRPTLNAPVGLQITAVNTGTNITFDNSVEGVNNGVYNGGSVTTSPSQGELNSNAWAFTGFSDGNIAFGGESPEDSAYESGVSDGNETEGGVYAFEVAPNNFALGIQPATGEFSPGSITLRFQNQTATPITSVSVGYKVYVNNNEAGSNSLNFSYSSNNTTYTDVAALGQATTAAADALPGWKAYFKVATIPVTVAANGYGYIRWSGAALSGTAFDEIAIDDIVLVANPTSNFASFSGPAETFTIAGNTTLSGNTTVAGNTTFSNNSYLAIGANTLTLNGTMTPAASGNLRGGASSSLVVSGTVSPSLSFDQSVPGTTNLLNNLTIATTNNTVTAATPLAIAGTLTVNEQQTFSMGVSALSGALSTVSNSGTITTQNTSATPLPSGKTWAGTGVVTLNGLAQQTLVPGTYNNLTVSNALGAVASGNATVNGTLHLPNANPTATLGSLAMGSNTLFMGPDAVNTGIGEVSGIITRNTGIVANKLYTFGHPYTSILFPPVGTLPTSMSLKIEPGVVPPNKTDAVSRRYEFIQAGGTGTKAIITSHYLDAELNGNTENRLTDWVVPIGAGAPIPQSRTNYSTTDNFVELANVNVAFFGPAFGQYHLALANSQTSTLVWNGSQSNSWTTAANWSPPGSPSLTTNVIIPDGATTPNDPVFNNGSEVLTMSIESGGILNAPAGSSTLTVRGTTGAWINKGTFNPAGGTVIFDNNTTAADATIAGTTVFNNLTVNTGTTLRALTDADVGLSGTFTKSGSFITGAVHSTFRYTGTNQTVVTPNGSQSAYHNLVISGTGAIFPASLNINGDLITNAVVDFSGKTISITGQDTETQVIGGTVSPVFSNLVINNNAGLTQLAADATVSGTLTLTSGVLNIGSNNLTLGANPIAGSFSTTAMIAAEGTGVVRRPYTATGSYFFPIGEMTSNTSYSPITVNITSASSFTNAYVAVNLRDAVHPNNYSTGSYMTRYWNVTQTGIANAIATVTANYIPGDAVGGESTLVAAQLNGAFDVNTNPWIKYTPLSGSTLTAANAVLTSGQLSVFTGIKASNITVLIIGEGSFCEGDAVTLTSEVSGGDTPYTYSWSGGLGSGATATPPTATAGTTTYTLTVRDANGIVSSDTADVVVSTPPVAGVLTGNQEVCANTTPADITLTGYTGNIVRWERSINTGFTNPVFISSTSATLTGLQIGNNFNSTRYVRAVIQNGSCPVVYSNYVEIKISSTTWDGTWSNGTPTATTAAIFNADFIATDDMAACTVVVNAGADVMIPSGFNITVDGSVTVNGGTFTVENNANLIQVRDVNNSGAISVIKNSAPIYRLDYTLWSSPVAGQGLLDFSPATLSNRFYTYNPATDSYNGISDPGSTDFEEGRGYLIRVANTHPAFVNTSTPGTPWTGTFTGEPHNGDVDVVVAPGFNAIGNPYPSSINIADFYAENEGNLAEDAPLSFWRKKNDSDASSYASLTLAGYIENDAFGGDSSNGVFDNPDESDEWVLNTAQGFIVETVSNTISFNNQMRRASNNGQFFRNAQNAEKSRLWLNLTGSQGEFSQMSVAYTENTTTGLDYGWDGRAFADGVVSIYSLAGESKLGIQARGSFVAADVVPLELKITSAGTYAITIDHVDGIFAQGQGIFIKDNLLGGQTHNLGESNYEFTAEAGTISGRFEIVYAEALGTGTPEMAANNVMVYKHDNTIRIDSGKTEMRSVSVYDTRGRLLHKAEGIYDTATVISTLQSEEQMLIIKITGTNGAMVSKKIIF
ncbi:T9SS sorting signal type C domain-containing protein [uncultured Flavobacterium sp.]|uniref:T9SS sorting signal type C domain-containing protein n=1 Tax=uncultured Flavobacterium sp. TaxID=165435 RepID=UPI0025ED609E|nr:T9SS sorting signal type C domain-containing protein [uncultured Flavobacterium sp.]